MKSAIKRKPRENDFSAYENNNFKGRSVRNHSSLGKSSSAGTGGAVVKTRRNIIQVNWSSDRNNNRCNSEMQAIGQIVRGSEQHNNLSVHQELLQKINNPRNSQPYQNHVLAGAVFQDQAQSSHTLHQAYQMQPLVQKAHIQGDRALKDVSELAHSFTSQQSSYYGDQEGGGDTNVIYSNFPSQTEQKGIRWRSRALVKQPVAGAVAMSGNLNP